MRPEELDVLVRVLIWPVLPVAILAVASWVRVTATWKERRARQLGRHRGPSPKQGVRERTAAAPSDLRRSASR